MSRRGQVIPLDPPPRRPIVVCYCSTCPSRRAVYEGDRPRGWELVDGRWACVNCLSLWRQAEEAEARRATT